MLDEAMDVCLIMPPFAHYMYPSLALSLLKACLTRAGITSWIDYASIRFLRLFGIKNSLKAYVMPEQFLLGEAFFAKMAGLTPKRTLEEFASYINKCIPHYNSKKIMQLLEEARYAAMLCINDTIKCILARNPKIVGVSSMFQQHNAALAILRGLKKIRPDIITMIGGANCMGNAGEAIIKNFPFVDYVFFGEADEIFADVCYAILHGKQYLPYGVIYNQGTAQAILPHRLTRNIDILPYPDYDDYFVALKENSLICRELEQLGNNYQRSCSFLLVEGSRGCWWGEKHPCTFCGLNGRIQCYRKKSPQRIFDEIINLSERYHNSDIFFSDNIMSRECLSELPKLLKKYPKKLRLFSEIKSNLTEQDIAELASVGFTNLQAGIESLQDHILQLMNKGNIAIQHIALLKYAKKHGVLLSWNLLYGFPGETKSDYEELYKHLILISHLTPPDKFIHISYHRNSLYWSDPLRYGLKLKPSVIYDFVTENNPDYIQDIAYNYENEAISHEQMEIHPIYQKINYIVQKWRNSYYSSTPERLEMIIQEDKLNITDSRKSRLSPSYTLTGLANELYIQCDKPIKLKNLYRNLSNKYASEEIDNCRKKLEDEKLLISIGDELLALAIDRIHHSQSHTL